MTSAFCIAVHSALKDTEQCPLAKGQCYWRHRDNGKCKYTAEDLTEAEFCQLVGAPLPSPRERDILLDKLRGALT